MYRADYETWDYAGREDWCVLDFAVVGGFAGGGDACEQFSAEFSR